MARARVAINGFGRIGRLFFRQSYGRPDFEVVAVNDLGDIQNLAYLLKYDTVYGIWGEPVMANAAGKALLVGGSGSGGGDGNDGDGARSDNALRVAVFQEKDPAKLPWRDMKIDVVVESTGFFESFDEANAHLAAGAKRAVISAPAKDDDGATGKTVLMGVNDGALAATALTSNGSCTTNAAAPVIQVMSENPGILKAVLNTVHGYTATQGLVDGPARGGKDFRRGRAAAQNIVPSTTGAAVSVTRAAPSLKGKFDGIALRVPVVSGSVADITFIAKRATTIAEINDIFRRAAADPRWEGILAVTEDQIVSSDVLGQPYGAIVDLNFTKVVDGDLVKVLSWYDNEYGYVATLVRHVARALTRT